MSMIGMCGGDEASALEEQSNYEDWLYDEYQYGYFIDESRPIQARRRERLKQIVETSEKLYRDARYYAKVGDEIICPECHRKMKKRTYQHVFCNTRHKDAFWNKRAEVYGWKKTIRDQKAMRNEPII